MKRPFVAPVPFFILRRPHPEHPGRNPAPSRLDDVSDLERTPGAIPSIFSPFRRPGRGDAALEGGAPDARGG